MDDNQTNLSHTNSPTMTSTLTGQNALQALSSSPRPDEDSISTYELDAKLQTQRKSLSTSIDSGVEVLKVSKVRPMCVCV